MSTYFNHYRKNVVSQLMKQFGYKNVMQVPRFTKVTLNMGISVHAAGKDQIDRALDDLTLISGQKAIPTHAKRSIAGFKIREGWKVGCKVTLRNQLMYEFLERLIVVVIPRIRDFRGYSIQSFDSFGNYNLGIAEQIVFPEIDYDKIDRMRGLNVCIGTSALKREEAYALLAAFAFPFKEKWADIAKKLAKKG